MKYVAGHCVVFCNTSLHTIFVAGLSCYNNVAVPSIPIKKKDGINNKLLTIFRYFRTRVWYQPSKTVNCLVHQGSQL